MSPVDSVPMLEPAYETTMRKCERCPAWYLEVKRIGEDGYRICCGCWFELAADTIVYGMDSFARKASLAAITHDEMQQQNYSPQASEAAEAYEKTCYLRQVEENKRHKVP